MRVLLLFLVAIALTSCASVPAPVDHGSDAPDARSRQSTGTKLPASYAEAIGTWRSPAEINEWIGARFEYDMVRAMKLSENQRDRGPRLVIYDPNSFYERPVGVCVDLARFAVETLRTTIPSVNATYLMMEFDPTIIAGNTLRRHWVAQFEVDGKFYYFGDSKRPGHLAGPYGTVQHYIEQYAQYRQRRIVSYRTLDSYERKLKKQAPRARREERA